MVTIAKQRGAGLILAFFFIAAMATYPAAMAMRTKVELQHQREAFVHWHLTHHAVVK